MTLTIVALSAGHDIEFPSLKKWKERILARPAVKHGMAVPTAGDLLCELTENTEQLLASADFEQCQAGCRQLSCCYFLRLHQFNKDIRPCPHMFSGWTHIVSFRPVSAADAKGRLEYQSYALTPLCVRPGIGGILTVHDSF